MEHSIRDTSTIATIYHIDLAIDWQAFIMSNNFRIIVLRKFFFVTVFYQSENRIPFSFELRPA